MANKPVDPLSSLALEWKPAIYHGSWDDDKDIFRHRVSASDGLPPYAQAKKIDLLVRRLKKLRPSAWLWVSVEARGDWFYLELQRLTKYNPWVLILPADEDLVMYHPSLEFIDLSPFRNNEFYPHVSPPFRLTDTDLKAGALCLLRILARLKSAYTREITSLAGFSETHVRHLLKELQAENLIDWKRIGKYEGWEINTRGLRLAQRSWDLPKGVHFKKHRGEFRYAGERHRRVARLWRAWLEASYRDIEIWECWTEVPVQPGIPDALAWGTHHGREMFFWLEVDSGHSSRKHIEDLYRQRIRQASRHSRTWGLPILFCVMGMRWVVDVIRRNLEPLIPSVAVIGHDWRSFGRLPAYNFGLWRDDLDWTRSERERREKQKLPFDPQHYPPKPKTRTPKPPKRKSTKPRFSKSGYDDDGYRPSGEYESKE